jgi:hypothetical protein
VLHQKDELAAVQPAGPLNIRLNVSDVVAILPDRRGAAADQLALLPPAESPDGWTVQKAIEPLTINVTSELNPAAHFEVVLDLSGPVGTVRATWREHRLELANQPDDLKAMDSLPPMILPIRFNPTGAIVSNIMLRVDHPPAH